MATLESTQIRVLVDSIRDRKFNRDEPHNEQDVREEQTPLLGAAQRGIGLQARSSCVKSKAALLVLCWNALITILVGYFLEYITVLATAADFVPYASKAQTYAPVGFGFLALLYFFYPLAGCLADTRCGRYKTIIGSP